MPNAQNSYLFHTMLCSICKQKALHRTKGDTCVECETFYRQNNRKYGKIKFWPREVVDYYYRNSNRKVKLYADTIKEITDMSDEEYAAACSRDMGRMLGYKD
jgi:hypothetical protein